MFQAMNCQVQLLYAVKKIPTFSFIILGWKFLSWLVTLYSEYDCENLKHDLHLNTILNTNHSRHHSLWIITYIGSGMIHKPEHSPFKMIIFVIYN